MLNLLKFNEVSWPIFFEKVEAGNIAPPHYILFYVSYTFFKDLQVICSFS